MSAPDSNPRLLPGVLAEIADVAGRDVALKVALAHGGDDGWDVPRNLEQPTGQALADLVGDQAARAIIGRFGGEALSVPLARRALVVHLYKLGLNTTEVADNLSITRRTARRYRREGAR